MSDTEYTPTLSELKRAWLRQFTPARDAVSEAEFDRAIAALATTGGETGADLIAAERTRQVTEEGYDPDHDKGHAGELTLAASSYALAGADDLDALGYVANNPIDPPAEWPWAGRYWKPTGDPIRDLTKAGALIAAAIDALGVPVDPTKEDKKP